MHNSQGEPQEYNGSYQACVNGGWAQDHSIRLLSEGLRRYDLDGVFFNMTGYQPVDYSGRYRGICNCQNCQEGFAERFGRKLPEREDFRDPASAGYLQFKRRTSQESAQRIYDTVNAVRPDTMRQPSRMRSARTNGVFRARNIGVVCSAARWA